MSQPDVTEEQQGDTPENQEPASPPRRRRLWLRRVLYVVLGLFALLIILVAALPTLASLSAVKQFALDRVNSTLRGKLDARSVALGWFSPCSIEGLQVRDADDREVLSIERLKLSASLWSLVTGGLDLGELRIDAPRVTLYLDENNNASISDAFASPEAPAEPEPQAAPPGASGGEVPRILAHLVVTDGAVTVARSGADAYKVSDLNVDFDIATLNSISGDLHAVLDDGATLAAEVEFNDAAKDGRLDVAKASGKGRIWTDRPVDIESLTRVVLQQPGISGTVALDVNARAAPGDAAVEYTLALAGVRTAAALPDAAPLDLNLGGDLTLVGDDVAGQLKLTGTPGEVSANLSAKRDPAGFAIDTAALLNAVLAGSTVKLPTFELNAESSIDLVKLDQALPGMLPLQEGQRLTGGQLTLSKLHASGGEQPAVQAELALTEVAAQLDGQRVQLEPIALAVDAGLTPGTGVGIDRADLTASFARLTAQGTITDLNAELSADLARAKRELGQILDLGALDFGGQVRGTLRLARTDDSTIASALDLTTRDAFVVTGAQRYVLKAVQIKQDGKLALADQTLERVEATSFSADLDGAVVASGTALFEPATERLDLRLKLTRADLAGAGRTGVAGLERFGGDVTGEISATRAAGDAPLILDGNLVAQRLTVDGKALFAQDATVDWSNVAVGGSGGVTVAELDLQAGATTVAAKDVALDPATALLTHGEVHAAADLSELFALVAVVADMEEPPALAGRLSLDASARADGAAQKLTGTVQVKDLAVGTGAQTVREPQLDLAFGAAIDQAAERVTLEQTQLTSGPLNVTLSGSVSDYGTVARADLTGRYDASWPVLTAMLHELAPATAGMVVLEGTSQSAFYVRGPLSDPGAKPPFKGVAAELGLGWDAAQLAGIQVSGAAFKPALANGVLTLPAGKISAAQGAISLGGTLDFTGADTTLRMPGTTRVLDGVTITPQLTREILSRINPIFYHVVTADGEVNLIVKQLILPLGDSIKEHGTGSGQLELIKMRIKPGGFVTELLILGGVVSTEEMVSVGVKGVSFNVKDGRILYDDFTLMFPDDFNVKFYGSVGFDDTLDLVVSLPIRAGLLRKLGVTGPLEQYAQALDGKYIDMPLVGTRQKPRLALDKVDKAKLVQEAAKSLGGDAIDDALKGLLGGNKKKKDGG
jgi:hypothetical protein